MIDLPKKQEMMTNKYIIDYTIDTQEEKIHSQHILMKIQKNQLLNKYSGNKDDQMVPFHTSASSDVKGLKLAGEYFYIKN